MLSSAGQGEIDKVRHRIEDYPEFTSAGSHVTLTTFLYSHIAQTTDQERGKTEPKTPKDRADSARVLMRNLFGNEELLGALESSHEAPSLLKSFVKGNHQFDMESAIECLQCHPRSLRFDPWIDLYYKEILDLVRKKATIASAFSMSQAEKSLRAGVNF